MLRRPVEELQLIKRRRESRLRQRHHRRVQSSPQRGDVLLLQAGHLPRLVAGAEAAGAPSDLSHLGGFEGADGGAVVLLHGCEDDALDVEVEAHPHRIRRDEHLLRLQRVIEESGLLAPRFGRQATVHHAAREAGGGLDLPFEGEDVAPREGDDAVPRAHLAQVAPDRARHLERRQPAILVLYQLVAARRHERLEERQGVRAAANMQLRGGQAEQCPRPGPAALRMGKHLDLIEDGHVHGLAQIAHLDGARSVTRAWDLDCLLAGAQVARHAGSVESVVDLVREQPQRPTIHARARRAQCRERVVGFATVGRAEMAVDPPPQRSSRRKCVVGQPHVGALARKASSFRRRPLMRDHRGGQVQGKRLLLLRVPRVESPPRRSGAAPCAVKGPRGTAWRVTRRILQKSCAPDRTVPRSRATRRMRGRHPRARTAGKHPEKFEELVLLRFKHK